MGSRGRGRGRGHMLTFNLEDLGLRPSDLFSPNPQTAPMLYPPVPRMPVPITNLDPSSVKQAEIARSIQTKLQQKSALLTLVDKKRDIERYSDKYQLNQQEEIWTPDWSQFPEELRPDPPRKRKKLTVRPNLKGARSANTAEVLAKVKERLGTQSTEDARKDDEEEKKEDEEDDEEKEEQEEEEEIEELDDEDDNDYNLTYFDNGEGYDDDDKDDDEPAYS